MEQDAVSALIEWIKDSSQIVFLTGSELCYEAGIPDIADKNFNPDINQYKNLPEVRKITGIKLKSIIRKYLLQTFTDS